MRIHRFLTVLRTKAALGGAALTAPARGIPPSVPDAGVGGITPLVMQHEKCLKSYDLYQLTLQYCRDTHASGCEGCDNWGCERLLNCGRRRVVRVSGEVYRGKV
ncbi:hypothetical protein SVAN01_09529 [Stagonosporopsis vannaccii]|nr:hypothetical protein SVAN01_09529 [Stagonosporopsis vannaccii]